MRIGLGDILASRSRTAARQINKDVIRREMIGKEPVRVKCSAGPREPKNRP